MIANRNLNNHVLAEGNHHRGITAMQFAALHNDLQICRFTASPAWRARDPAGSLRQATADIYTDRAFTTAT